MGQEAIVPGTAEADSVWVIATLRCDRCMHAWVHSMLIGARLERDKPETTREHGDESEARYARPTLLTRDVLTRAGRH